MRRTHFDLLLITDPSTAGWLDAVHAAIEAAPPGRVAIQVRDPRAGAAELAHLASGLRAVTRARGVPLLVNDRADVALLVGADGLHLKESGLEVADARALLGAGAVVGASCHDEGGLRRRADADFVLLGPFAEVPGKARPLGPARFARLAGASRTPVLALGGIGPHNAADALRAGAAGLAVARAIQAARDPAAATRALLDAIDAALHEALR